MSVKRSDREWEKFGKSAPYFGVITEDKYMDSHQTKENLDEFFLSGASHVSSVFQKIKANINPLFAPESILDFGCGVGRLVIPFASYADSVVGMDVSESMLAEAKKNCEARSLTNTTFVLSDDNLSRVHRKFDLIHSFIVFQHIPTVRGERIFKRMLACLNEGGVGVIHFTYTKSTFKRKLIPVVKRFLPFSQLIANLMKGRDISTPQMEMNSYRLDRIMMMIQQLNVHHVYTEFTDHAGELGVVIYFCKPKSGPHPV